VLIYHLQDLLDLVGIMLLNLLCYGLRGRDSGEEMSVGPGTVGKEGNRRMMYCKLEVGGSSVLRVHGENFI
jgi:hypothetical protein